jgi:hypothetical protein
MIHNQRKICPPPQFMTKMHIFLQLSIRYIVNGNRKMYRSVSVGKCDISHRFSQLKGDEGQCLVILTDNPEISLRKRTGKAGLLPGWRVRDQAHVVHLVPDVGLVAHAVGGDVARSVIGMGLVALVVAGDITARSVMDLAPVDTGVYPMRF